MSKEFGGRCGFEEFDRGNHLDKMSRDDRGGGGGGGVVEYNPGVHRGTRSREGGVGGGEGDPRVHCDRMSRKVRKGIKKENRKEKRQIKEKQKQSRSKGKGRSSGIQKQSK